MKLIKNKTFLISILIASIVAAIITHFSSLPFWVVLLMILVAMYINGVVAEREDNEPGGFLNPNGDNPKWPLTVTFEDGSKEQYKNEEDLECNLEFFNSNQDKDCEVTDALGKQVHLILSGLEIKEIKYK